MIKEGVKVSSAIEYDNVIYTIALDNNINKNSYTLTINNTTNNIIDGVALVLKDRILIKN